MTKRVSGAVPGEPARRRGHRGSARSRTSRARSLRQLVAVVAQEQLLERRRMADQAAHAELAESAHRCVEVLGVDVEAHAVAVDLEAVDPGEVGQPVGGPYRLGGDRRAGQVPQLAERAALLRFARRG